MSVSERRMCRVLGQHRSTQRKVPRGADDEAALTGDIIALARQYGRYGYRRVTALLHDAGWHVNRKREERIWRREGLKVPHRQPKRSRLWLNDGSCIGESCRMNTIACMARLALALSVASGLSLDHQFLMVVARRHGNNVLKLNNIFVRSAQRGHFCRTIPSPIVAMHGVSGSCFHAQA